MKASPTSLPGVLLVELDVHADRRGTLVESFHEAHHAALGVAVGLRFVQDNLSSSRAGVVRGLHYQLTRPQGKLVQVVRGAIFDVVVDVRRSAPSFGRWYGVELSADNRRQLWIPPGFAHGFQAVSADADVLYKLTAPYLPADERALRWDDPDLAIAWPVRAGVIVSERDARAPGLRDAELPP